MNYYAKAIAAFFTALGTWGTTALVDDGISGVEWFGLCGVIVSTVTVWGVTNGVARKRDAHGRFVSEGG